MDSGKVSGRGANMQRDEADGYRLRASRDRQGIKMHDHAPEGPGNISICVLQLRTNAEPLVDPHTRDGLQQRAIFGRSLDHLRPLGDAV